jgi:hypothetical protein
LARLCGAQYSTDPHGAGVLALYVQPLLQLFVQDIDFIEFFSAYFVINLTQANIHARCAAPRTGLLTKLSTETVSFTTLAALMRSMRGENTEPLRTLVHNSQPSHRSFFGDPIVFHHTSGRLAHLAADYLLHRGPGFDY